MTYSMSGFHVRFRAATALQVTDSNKVRAFPVAWGQLQTIGKRHVSSGAAEISVHPVRDPVR